MLNGDDFDEVAKAHYEVFKDVRPVTSTQVVSMRHAGWRIEIEAEAIID
jgi:hypothetical protein